MKKSLAVSINLILFFFIAHNPTLTQNLPDLSLSFNLTGNRTTDPQYYIQTTKLITYSLDGVIAEREKFILYLMCEPSGKRGLTGDKYICGKILWIKNDSTLTSISSLKGWSYYFNPDSTGMDEAGQVFGIDHAKFEKLTNNIGDQVPADKSYHVYNSFIDFHAFCNLFAEKTTNGKGAQDLHFIGDKIIHPASFSEAPVNLGSNIKEGSFFKNGEITLAFKGLSVISNNSCAILHFDSGESSLKMGMTLIPDVDIETVGTSHYFGDIFIDLNSYWVQKVEMSEFVVTKTVLPFPPNKINSVVEREVIIRNVGMDEFNHK